MTIEEALAIIGGPGEVYFENGKEGEETYEIDIAPLLGGDLTEIFRFRWRKVYFSSQ